MIDKSKCDPFLGDLIAQKLKAFGCESPINSGSYTDTTKIEMIKESVRDILCILGMDISDDSIADTPKRVAEMFVNELYYGLDYANFPICTAIENKLGSGMVIERDIVTMSTCEHHLVTIDGLATVAYIPNKIVIGLSKINRIVDFFAKRPQIQERLTKQIAVAMMCILGTEDVAVVVKAKHYCVKSRGIKDVLSDTITTSFNGVFKEEKTMNEFFMLVNK